MLPVLLFFGRLSEECLACEQKGFIGTLKGMRSGCGLVDD